MGGKKKLKKPPVATKDCTEKCISLRAYARLRGVAVRSVHQAIEAGRIHVEADGRIDPDKADADWTANTDVGKIRGKDGAPPATNYAISRAEREATAAKILQIDLDERLGGLISRDNLTATLSAVLITLRGNLLNIGENLVRASGFAARDAAAVDKAVGLALSRCAKELGEIAGKAVVH